MRFWKFIIALGLFSWLHRGMGQPLLTSEAFRRGFQVESWTSESGLPQNSITTITQTRDGFLWIGTYYGLVRFDGIRFRIFDPSNTPALSQYRIERLVADPEDGLWIALAGGGVVQYREGRFQHFGEKHGLPESTLTALHLNRQGTLFAGTSGGELSIWQSGLLTASTLQLTGLRQRLTFFHEDSEGDLWLGTPRTLGRYRDGEFEPIEDLPPFPLQFATSLEGRIWVCSAGRLLEYSEGLLIADHGQVPGGGEGADILCMVVDRRDGVWVGTRGSGVILYQNGEFQTIGTAEGLSQNTVSCLYEDREGNIWAGTLGGGLNRLRERPFVFLDERLGLPDNAALAIHEDQDRSVWVGTDGGGLLRIQDGNVETFKRRQGLDHESVWSVLPLETGEVLVGTLGGGVYRMGPDGFVREPMEGLQDPWVKMLYQDITGVVYAGTAEHGLWRRLKDGTWKSADEALGLPTSLDVRAMLRSRSGVLWVGTGEDGLYRIVASGVERFAVGQGLPSNGVRCLLEDLEGRLWVGTGHGLAVLRNKKWSHVSREVGFPSEVISQVFEDSRGNLWLGTYGGMLRMSKSELDRYLDGDTQELGVVGYNRHDGLPAHECMGGFQPAGYHASDGSLWFPTSGGVAIIDPDHLRVNHIPPPVLIQSVDIDGKVIEARDRIVVGPERERIRLGFTGLSFTSPRKVKFKYRLEGHDVRWQGPTSTRFAEYVSLPPGEYRFHVLAGNRDDIWNQMGDSIQIHILAPFWRSWWFISLSTLTLVGAGVMVFRHLSLKQMQRQLTELEQLNALERERARIAKDMHDDLGASMTQIGLLSELMSRPSVGPEKMAELAGKLKHRTRWVSDTLDEIVWAVNPRNDSLERLLSYLVHHADESFEFSEIRCRMDVPTQVPDQHLRADVRHNLFMVFKETINNALKHSGATEVVVRVVLEPGQLILSIQDNGNGFDTRQESDLGNGLLNMKKRMEEVGGTWRIESQPGSGTRTLVTLPL